MPISREQKSELVDTYKGLITTSEAIVMTSYRGLTVDKLEKLRRSLREAGGGYIIAKKTLMSRALTELDRPVPKEALQGPVGFAFLGEDISAGARVLRDFSKENADLFAVLGGVLGSSIVDASGAASLADLPTREVQLALLIGAIVAPLTSLAGLITAPHRDLVGLLQARIDKEGGAEQADAA